MGGQPQPKSYQPQPYSFNNPYPDYHEPRSPTFIASPEEIDADQLALIFQVFSGGKTINQFLRENGVCLNSMSIAPNFIGRNYHHVNPDSNYHNPDSNYHNPNSNYRNPDSNYYNADSLFSPAPFSPRHRGATTGY